MTRCLLTTLILVGSVTSPALVAGQELNLVNRPQLGDVLRQGPVHEAFAKLVSPRAEMPPAAEKTPPAPLREERPEIAPELAERAAWIPGYWNWDDQREEFVWVSGVWRFPPPGRRWIPSRWVQSDDGPQRVEGFWAPTEAAQVALLPAPPEYPQDALLVKETPEDQFWVPGCYVLSEGKYQWREGFAAQVADDWVWTPAHYVWTPDGWVFIEGFWDYPLKARGQAFAALTFENDNYALPDFRLLTAYPVPLDAISRAENGYVYEIPEDQELAENVTVSFVAPAVDLAPPDPPRAIVAAAPRKGVIQGVVRRGRLTPDGILVKLEGSGIPPYRTDDTGRFIFRDVPYGEYTIYADGAVQNIIRRGRAFVQLAEPVLDDVVIPLE